MQLSKNCRSFNATGKIFVKKLVGAGGFEPPTLRLSSACSNQLSYAPAFAEASAGKPTSSTGPFAVVPNSFGTKENGADEDRTRDLLLAKQALSQLS